MYPYELTRRHFLQLSGGVLTAIASGEEPEGTIAEPTRNFEYGDPLREFGYNQVEFRSGPQQEQLENTHQILMGMDEDSLLRPFRMAAGLPAPGRDLGGWYSSDAGMRPTTFGQWVSALSRYYAITADEATRAKVHRLVQAFSSTVDDSGNLYVGQDTYLYDKLACGLVDAHRFTRQPIALTTLARATAAAAGHFPPRAGRNLGTESFTLPENQFIAWQLGGDSRHLAIAQQFIYHDFFEPLARGENVLATRHAYSHVNSLSSAAKAYLVLGEEKYLRAAINGLRFVEEQSFATGGWGPAERFLPVEATDYTDPGIGEKLHEPAWHSLADSLVRATCHFETPCGSYAHFKLTRYLLRITKNARYGDSMERVMYNTILGAKPLNKFGSAFYQSNYHAHANKEYFDGYDGVVPASWPCCSGTLPQVVADYRISTYFRDPDGVFVNLYIPSTLRWEQHGAQISMTQSGSYPLDDNIAFDIIVSRATRFRVRLRIPMWAGFATIRINGKKIADPVVSGTFATISREWKSGDRIELELPRSLELKPVDDRHPNVVALVCGPLVLFAISDDTPTLTRTQLMSARQLARGAAEWQVDTNAGPLRLAPFWALKDEMYFTYIPVRSAI